MFQLDSILETRTKSTRSLRAGTQWGRHTFEQPLSSRRNS